VIGGSTRTLPGPAPTNPQITGLYHHHERHLGSVVSYSGYSLEASTANDFTGTLITSTTPNGSLTGLTFNANDLVANTTYYLRVGSLWNGTTAYADTTPASTSTLASLLSGSSLRRIELHGDRQLGGLWVWLRSEQIGRLPSPSIHRIRFQQGRGSSQTTDVTQSTLTVNGYC